MLLVKPCCAYLVSIDPPWRPIDHDAHFYTLMVKGARDRLNVRKWSRLPSLTKPGTTELFENKEEDVARVRERFGQWATRALKARNVKSISLFPVPNSHATPDMTGTYGTREIAEAVARAFGPNAEVIDRLRFKQPMQSAHSGAGTRNPSELRGALIFPSGAKPKGLPILIDDVLTTGAHLIAARDVIAAKGIDIKHALVCGRRSVSQLPDPFDVDEEDIDRASSFGVQEDATHFQR